jgi:hypothetical protein
LISLQKVRDTIYKKLSFPISNFRLQISNLKTFGEKYTSYVEWEKPIQRQEEDGWIKKKDTGTRGCGEAEMRDNKKNDAGMRSADLEL